MIPQPFIDEHRMFAPWSNPTQIEHDLIVCRMLVEMFGNEELANMLAFRGGTALMKLHFPGVRHSEDIDLVLTKPGSVGKIFDLIRGLLDNDFGRPKRDRSEMLSTLKYRLDSESMPSVRMNIKIEINMTEMKPVFGFEHIPFKVTNSWFTGNANVKSYPLHELLGTKLRALYQRKKGRDLFDLHYAINQSNVDMDKVVYCFREYLKWSGQTISRREFELNMNEKYHDENFRTDVKDFINPSIEWNFEEAFNEVLQKIISKL